MMVAWRPQVLGIIEDRYGLASAGLGFLVVASLLMVLCTLGDMLVKTVMFSIGMSVSVPDLLWHSGV